MLKAETALLKQTNCLKGKIPVLMIAESSMLHVGCVESAGHSDEWYYQMSYNVIVAYYPKLANSISRENIKAWKILNLVQFSEESNRRNTPAMRLTFVRTAFEWVVQSKDEVNITPKILSSSTRTIGQRPIVRVDEPYLH